MSEIKNRMLHFLEHLEIGQKAFEKNIGISNGYVNNIGKSIGTTILTKIKEKYPELNTDWLLTGNGDMLNNESTGMPKAVTIKGSPLIPIDAVAGFGTGDNEGVSYEDCDHYVVPEFDKRGMEFLIRVSGSSMYPKYSNGDILACKKIHEITFFQWGKVYVIDSNQGALVKRIFEDPNNKNNIICVSDNKENYPPFSMPKKDIRSLSIVLGVVRME